MRAPCWTEMGTSPSATENFHFSVRVPECPQEPTSIDLRVPNKCQQAGKFANTGSRRNVQGWLYTFMNLIPSLLLSCDFVNVSIKSLLWISRPFNLVRFKLPSVSSLWWAATSISAQLLQSPGCCFLFRHLHFQFNDEKKFEGNTQILGNPFLWLSPPGSSKLQWHWWPHTLSFGFSDQWNRGSLLDLAFLFHVVDWAGLFGNSHINVESSNVFSSWKVYIY